MVSISISLTKGCSKSVEGIEPNFYLYNRDDDYIISFDNINNYKCLNLQKKVIFVIHGKTVKPFYNFRYFVIYLFIFITKVLQTELENLILNGFILKMNF